MALRRFSEVNADPDTPAGETAIALGQLIDNTHDDIRRVRRLRVLHVDGAKAVRYADKIAKLREQLKELEDDLRAIQD